MAFIAALPPVLLKKRCTRELSEGEFVLWAYFPPLIVSAAYVFVICPVLMYAGVIHRLADSMSVALLGLICLILSAAFAGAGLALNALSKGIARLKGSKPRGIVGRIRRKKE